MKSKITISILAIMMAVFIFDALTNIGHTNGGGAPAGATGSPGDGVNNSCGRNGCHGVTATTATGWITSDIPSQGYIGGNIYTITATASYTGRVKFGFEIACQNTSGTPLGTLINTSTQTQLMSGNYITHTALGTSGSNSKTWTFNWKAPATGTGQVTFYGAFNCTNNDGGSGGDLIYTSTLAVPEFTVTGVDAGVLSFSTPASNNCTTTITPVVKVRNYGSVTMTSCTVNYVIDNGSPTPFTWNGSLAAATNATCTLPAATVTPGFHTIKAYTTYPNGGADANATDDTAVTYFSANGSVPIFSEGFESSIYPPPGWSLVNADNSHTWERVKEAHHSGTAAAHMNNYYYNAAGQIDELVSPVIDISSSVTPQLSFYVAYQMYTGNTSDSLRVFISTDCGATYTSIYSKAGTALQTTPSSSTAEFVPTITQWRKDSVSLSAYTSFPNIILKFRNKCEYGNDMYLDDINITGTSAGMPIVENNLFNLSVFPNPTNGIMNVGFSINKHDVVTIKLFDIYGKLINTFLNESKDKGDYNLSFDLKNYASGLYFLKVIAGEGSLVRKVFVQ